MRFAVGAGRVRRRLPWLLLLALLAPQAQAQVTIHRCTDASGAVTLQNDTPCPPGSKEVKRVVEPAPQQSRAQFLATGAPPPPAASPAAPPAPPKAAPAAAAVAAPPVSPAPASSLSERAPDRAARMAPPPLFECRTWEGHRYLGDEAQPAPRCIPLAVTGLDGSNATAGAGSACQMVDDECQAVPEALLCQGWSQRLSDVESQSVGGGDNRAYAQAEAARLRAIIDGSTCAPP